jgi:hypothetical protein
MHDDAPGFPGFTRERNVSMTAYLKDDPRNAINEAVNAACIAADRQGRLEGYNRGVEELRCAIQARLLLRKNHERQSEQRTKKGSKAQAVCRTTLATLNNTVVMVNECAKQAAHSMAQTKLNAVRGGDEPLRQAALNVLNGLQAVLQSEVSGKAVLLLVYPYGDYDLSEASGDFHHFAAVNSSITLGDLRQLEAAAKSS